MAIEIHPVTPALWPEVGRAFGPGEKKADSCWCQRFRRHGEADNRSALRREVLEADVPVGLAAISADQVIGWTRVVPRAALPGIVENRALDRLLHDDPDAWWVSCFVVRREHRGNGVGTVLLEGAFDWAARHGASVLDGHPVDTAVLRGQPSPSAVFTGTASMFRAAGFSEIGRTYRSRPVMRRGC